LGKITEMTAKTVITEKQTILTLQLSNASDDNGFFTIDVGVFYFSNFVSYLKVQVYTRLKSTCTMLLKVNKEKSGK
jgi:hypothetical protein